MQPVYKSIIYGLTRNILSRKLSFRRTNITYRLCTPKVSLYIPNSKNSTYNSIVELLQSLVEKRILGNELSNALVKHIKQCDDSHIGNDSTTIKPYYDDLLPLIDMKKCSQDYEDDKIKCLSTHLLQAMKHQKYSVVELLIKLKLIFSDLLKDISLAKTPKDLLYYQDTSEERVQSPIVAQDEFLNELMNAPLDDIGIFLEEHGENFEKYYTRDIIEDLVYRISHDDYNKSNDPKDIVNQLCIFITETMAARYAPLTTIELISYIEDQYHAEETPKYRLLLKNYVATKPKRFTLNNFYETVNIKPVFTSELQQSFENLFSVYCEKFLQHIQQNNSLVKNDDLKVSAPQQRQECQEKMEEQTMRNEALTVPETKKVGY